MSEGIIFRSLAYKSPERRTQSRIRRIGLYAEIADRITQRRQRKEDKKSKESSFSLGSIFAIGRYAVGVTQARMKERHFTF